jgi:hypothetical protein
MSSYCGFRRTILSRSGEWRGWTGLWSRRKSTCEYSYITARPCADAKTYSEVLYRTYERYVEIQGERTRAQRSWVSGLEPAYQSYTTGHEAIPEVPRRCAYKSWIESEMYYKHGVEVKREGRFEGNWSDEKKWDRLVWSALDANYLGAKKQKPVVEPEESLPYRPMDTKHPSFLSGSNSVPVSRSSKTPSSVPGGVSSPLTLAAKSDLGLTTMSRSQTPREASLPHSSIPKSDHVPTNMSNFQILDEASSPESLIPKSHPEAEQLRDGFTRQN